MYINTKHKILQKNLQDTYVPVYVVCFVLLCFAFLYFFLSFFFFFFFFFFCGLACFVVFSYPVRYYFTCFTLMNCDCLVYSVSVCHHRIYISLVCYVIPVRYGFVIWYGNIFPTAEVYSFLHNV